MSEASSNRNEERRKVHWRAFVLLPEGTKLPVLVINVSGEGIGVLSDRAFAVNTRLALIVGVPLPTDASRLTAVNVTANVRYSVLSGEHFQIGMRLEQVSDADKRRILEASHRH